MRIYKILRADEWAALARDALPGGAPVDRADGFIHFSTAAQLAETAAKHFAGASDLVLAAFESGAFGPDLKWEVSRGGAEFPHLYAPLRRADVLWHAPLPLRDGTHLLPEDL